MEFYRPYVAGHFVDTRARRTLRAPFDGAAFAEVYVAGPSEIEAAIAGAVAAAPVLKAMPRFERAAILRETAVELARQRHEIALGMCREGGKPISDARAEVDRAVHCFEIAAAESERLGGEVMPLDLRPAARGKLGLTRRFPVGPVAGIAPFNFPLNLGVHKVAPALAAGCPVILKPASQTPTSCLRLASILDELLPPGALSVLPCPAETAAPLVEDDRIRLLSFTGSAEVGWDLKRRAGRKRVVLELGGNAAVVVDDGADLERAVPRIVYGAFSYAGQKCIAVQRIYAHAAIYDRLIAALLEATRAVRTGDPFDELVLVGPVISEAAAEEIVRRIREAVQWGGRLLCGGRRSGSIVEPTIVEDVPEEAALTCEETFGPVVTVKKVTDFYEGLALANRSRFGLQAGVYTPRLDHALAAWERLEVGGVVVNDVPTFRIDPMPYGGVKDSGLGREGIRYAMEEMTEIRLLVLSGVG